ncbi:MAG: hypothetical protein HYR94_23580 [Chloroflexi bacterium]|nr:hypothetical protein [Chloroflexota bacterium]
MAKKKLSRDQQIPLCYRFTKIEMNSREVESVPACGRKEEGGQVRQKRRYRLEKKPVLGQGRTPPWVKKMVVKRGQE